MTALGMDLTRRMAAIAAYDAVRMPPRAQLGPLVELAAQVGGVSRASVAVLTDTEHHQIATVGSEASPGPLAQALCEATVEGGLPIALSDASADPRFASQVPSGEGAEPVRFFVAHPLISRDGVAFGVLCVLDDQARELDAARLSGLATLAERIVDVFELRLRGRELALGSMELNAVQAELDRCNERLASFAGQVSHDLKTPLTTLSLSLSLIREQLHAGEIGPECTSLLDRAIRGSARMSDLIDDVLDYARLGGTLRATEVDLDFVLGEVLSELGSELAGVDLHIGRLPTVLGDRAQLRAVLENLLGNATKYRCPDRKLVVRIDARHVQRAWRIEITDNGRGIAPTDRGMVFEPLGRVDEVASVVEGSGIGLATCRRIVGAHGGAIGIDPTYDGGSRFWFELPD